ncbi:unnamed protein product [Tuber aestivum]|uniref:Uncharacterized protein n=1 Tax=Tuber aestivum TaxID=59557 RepID=A0A292Q5D8_9PEZI|nr:unnamed protein product [Tuber aestivum]
MPSVHSSLPSVLNLFLLLLTPQTTAHPTQRTDPGAGVPPALPPSVPTPLDLLRRDLQTRSISDFFTTPTIIALAAGGSSFLLLIVLLCVCCHRKRKQGREILAAYEAPDRTPYESIRLRERGSTGSASPPAVEKSGARKDDLQVRVSAVVVPVEGYSPRSSSLGARGAQGVSVPGRVLVRGNGGWEREAGGIPPPASPFRPRPAPSFSPYSPTNSPTPPIPPYEPPSPWPAPGPYGRAGGVAIGGAL